MNERVRGAPFRSLAIAAASFLLFWLANRTYDAGRGDLFYLADAFLHGRVDIAARLGPQDVIVQDGRLYVPFPPFPAIALMPIVALLGPLVADQWEPAINAAFGAGIVVGAWLLTGRLGVRRSIDRLWLTLLLGFSTPVVWLVTRGGVWHTGQLIATLLTLALLAELFGPRRAWLLGLLLGAMFLSRPPLAFAGPIVALWLAVDGGSHRIALRPRPSAWPWRKWLTLVAAAVPALLFFLAYNLVRFGSPMETGYGLAVLPDFLEANRQKGLFALAHVPMNLDYLLLHLPDLVPAFPFFRPDGLGMSILLTSPGLLLALRAPRDDHRTWLLLGAALAVLIPTLLYYGGGWLQFGYRYALDSIPFVWAACVLAARRTPRLAVGWKLLIALGVLVNAAGIYWAHAL